MSNLTDFLFPKATEQQARDGASNSVLMTPLSTAHAIAEMGFNVEVQTFETSSVFQKHPDDIFYYVEAWGGGGSGGTNTRTGGISGARYSLGGDGGYYNATMLLAEPLPSSISVVVGAGGAPVEAPSSSSQPGLPGGESSFGDYLVALGGDGGLDALGDRNATIVKTWAGAHATAGVNNRSITIKGGLSGRSGVRSDGTKMYANEIISLAFPSAVVSSEPGADGEYVGAGGNGTWTGPTGAGYRGEVRVYRFKRVKP